jgi:ABC-type amino acid transport substrate-binding protein
MKRFTTTLLLCITLHALPGLAGDLNDIKARGELRHLGVPYANFIDGRGGGLDAELMQLFAAHLGLAYRYVETTWTDVIPDLLGVRVAAESGGGLFGDAVPIKGDIVANGMTILPWRRQAVAYSTPTFPNQIWLLTTRAAKLRPIVPSGNLAEDIGKVKKMLQGVTVLGQKGTCADLSLYRIGETGAVPVEFSGNFNELAPALLDGAANAVLLGVPDALVALEKWPGQVIVVGPVSEMQPMGVAFRPDAPELLSTFNAFYKTLLHDGTYQKLVEKYYPAVYDHFSDFFTQ